MGRLWLTWGDQLTSFKNSRNLRAIVGVINICSQENSKENSQCKDLEGRAFLQVFRHPVFINWNYNAFPKISLSLSSTLVYPFVVVIQLLSHVQLVATPLTAAHQASLSFTISWSLLKLTSVDLVMPSNYLILCCPLLLLPSTFSQHQGLFQCIDSLHQVAKILEVELQHQLFQWIFRANFL